MPKKKIEATATAKRKVTIRPFPTSDRVNLGASGLRSSLILIMLIPSLAGYLHYRKVTWDIILPQPQLGYKADCGELQQERVAA